MRFAWDVSKISQKQVLKRSRRSLNVNCSSKYCDNTNKKGIKEFKIKQAVK